MAGKTTRANCRVKTLTQETLGPRKREKELRMPFPEKGRSWKKKETHIWAPGRGKDYSEERGH